MNQQHYQLSLEGQLNFLGCPLYAAKAFGRRGFSTYVPSVGSTLRKCASAIDAVRDSLKHHRLEVSCQPKVALGSKRTEGFEAIPRLRCNNGFPVPEATIRYAMDDIDVTRQVDGGMFDRATENVKTWLEAAVNAAHVGDT